MKLAVSVIFATMAAVALAKGFTPEMIKRNGLTDEQIDAVFAANTNAQLRLTRQDWMNLQYRMHRFENMKWWLNLGIEGKLGDEILRVTDDNGRLSTSNDHLRAISERWHNRYSWATNDLAEAWSEYRASTNRYAILQNAWNTAKQRNQEAIGKLDEIDKKYPLLKAITAKIRELINIVD